MRRERRACRTLCVALAVGVAAPGLAQDRTAPLPDLTLEQLVEVQLVSVVSKRPQRAADAPSVVTVVTAEEIRLQGYRTLADVLRALPGFYVSYDRNYSYVGVRGFGRPGDYNTRILVLVDGVRTNDDIYDSGFVGSEATLDPELIERIEISRGPGAAVYGDNAFFAVVSIATKRGRDVPKLELSASAGSYGTYSSRATLGRTFGNGGSVLASASLSASDGQTLSYPEFADVNGGVVAGGDGEHAGRAFASYARGGFTAEVLRSSRKKHIPTASYDMRFGDTRALTRDAFTIVSASYEHSFGARFDWRNRISHLAYDYDGTYPLAAPAGASSLYTDYARGRWWTADSSGVLRAGTHTLMLGAEISDHARQDQGGGTAGEPATEFHVSDRALRYGLSVQDDVVIGEHVRLSAGGRYDHHEEFGGTAHPRLALIVAPGSRRTTLKLIYGSAFRAPNEYEQQYYVGQGVEQQPLRPETIRTVEASVERGLGDAVRLSASLFDNRIRDLIALESTPAGDLAFRNVEGAHSRGLEAALEARLGSGALGRASYSYQHTRDVAGAPLTNSPVHMLKANVSIPFAGRSCWASARAQYMSRRLTLAGAETPGFLLVDTIVSARWRHGLEGSFGVLNLLGTRYSDPGSEEHRQDTIRQDGRSVWVRLGWSF